MRSILRRGRFLLLALLVVAVIVPGAAMAQEEDERGGSAIERPSFKPPRNETVPGQIIVRFKVNARSGAKADIRRQQGLEKQKDLDLISAEVDKVKGQSAEAAVRAMNRSNAVEYATLDRKVYATGYTDEPRFSELWGLNNTGQAIDGVTGTSDMDVNGKEASARTQGAPSVTVAVIDSGVDFTHPDLAGQAWKNPGESGGGKENNGIDDDGNGFVDDVDGADFFNGDGDPYDDNSHGTHVAGTIAASVNGQGVVGVAPNVKIMALKFLNSSGGGTLSDAIRAIEYAKSKGATISNNSWGYLGPPDAALRDAVKNSGQLFIAAAGNDGLDADAGGFAPNGDPNRAGYPGGYNLPNVLSVAAIDNQGNLASFSNYGANSVDISAPGVDILSSVPGVPATPAVALSSVGSSGGKALSAGFGADEIGTSAGRASFMRKAFTAVGRGSQQVVLVGDDGSSNASGLNPDVGPAIKAAIQGATGSAPQVIDVPDGANGPGLSQLSGKTVVWATGQDFGCDPDAALSQADQTTLTNFLDGGGKLVLNGADALYCIEGSSFVTGSLKLNVTTDIIGETFEGSAGTAFAGELYDLDSPTSIFYAHDRLKPITPAAVVQGNYGGSTPGTWEYFSGTSMATPHVAGVAALVASKYPGSSPTTLKSVVMSSGKKVPATTGKTVTGKMADARAALYPRVTGTSPAAGATGVARTANVTATFSEAMNATTISATTFTLVKSGTTTPVGASVSYDAQAKKATLNPSADLAPGATYTATVKAGSSGVKNATPGDPMVANKTWKFTVSP